MPVILSTWSFGKWCNDAAWPGLAGGGSALDAVERAANAAELDPRVDSVGLGGMPDATGQVTLDAAIMSSPQRWGSVLCVRGYAEAASIARRLMERSGRGIRTGEGAEQFAAAEGFRPRELLTDATRTWYAARRDSRQRAIDLPREPVGILDTFDGRLHLSAEERRHAGHDTVGIVALDARGELAACTSTSGMPLKPVGRVGDSAVLGHGLYVEPGVGAVVATGAGELISSVCACMEVIAELRRGREPRDAVRAALVRMDGATPKGQEPQAAIVCLAGDGRWSSGALREGFFVAITDARGTRVERPELVLHADRGLEGSSSPA